MIVTKVEIDSVEQEEYQKLKVNSAISDYNSSSNFSVIYDSPFGRHSTSFSVGNEIKIYADDSDASTTLLTGIIEKVQFKGRDNTQTITLSGRDYSLRLQDSTVKPIVYTDAEISTIVTDIIVDNVSDITTTNVDVTETTLKRIAFNHTPVFEALRQLAELAGYFFYIDDKDLHFEKRANISSGITLDNDNINRAKLNQTREGMANSVYVYGDRMLAGFQEEINFDGGSAYTLLSKPRNTLLEVTGVPQIGGVFELTVEPISGPNYLVSFNDKEIIFISGTDVGYDSIPPNGESGLIQYDRDIPIVKFGTDRESIRLYGKKEKIINDKTITDPNTATDILRKELAKGNPFKGVECDIKGWHSITPGNTARVTLSDFNIDEEIGILSVSYNFDRNRVQSERVIKIKLDKKIIDITDQITDLRNRLNAIESSDRQESDQITRLEKSDEQYSAVGSNWEIKTNEVTGSTFHLYATNFIPPVNPFHLSPGALAGSLAGGTVGSAFTELDVVESGGFYN